MQTTPGQRIPYRDKAVISPATPRRRMRQHRPTWPYLGAAIDLLETAKPRQMQREQRTRAKSFWMM